MQVVTQIQLQEGHPERVQVYGTCFEPLFDARQILLEVAGYDSVRNCSVFSEIKYDPNQVQIHDGRVFLTDEGLISVLFRSKKDRAYAYRMLFVSVIGDLKTRGFIRLAAETRSERRLLPPGVTFYTTDIDTRAVSSQ